MPLRQLLQSEVLEAIPFAECAHLTMPAFEALEASVNRFGIALMLVLLFITFMLAYIFHIKHFTYVHEAGAALLMGVFVGWIVHNIKASCTAVLLKEALKFNKDIFFLMLLPPIIFESGYNMKRLHFFSNLGAICMYAFAGTFISTVVIGALMLMAGYSGWSYNFTVVESFAFGSLISATDPVTVLAIFSEMKADLNLYSMVFGESVLNDAVAIVLYRTVTQFHEPDKKVTFIAVLGGIGFFIKVFAGSLLIGAFFGMMAALLYKHTVLSEEHLEHLESATTAVFPYLSWMIAEALGLSGIIAILFCGIVMAQYACPNMSDNTQTFTRKFYKMVAMLSETFVFVYMGLAMFTYELTFSVKTIIVGILVVMWSRTFNVWPCTLVLNIFRPKDKKIDSRFQFMLWFSGLRGAIAFALALEATVEYPDGGVAMLSTTLCVILFTVLTIGGTCATLMTALKVKQPPGQQEEALDVETLGKRTRWVHKQERRLLNPVLTASGKKHHDAGEHGHGAGTASGIEMAAVSTVAIEDL